MVSLQVFILAFTLGIFSSFHCVGMCGAIAFSLPVNTLPSQKKLFGILLYNLGRLITYSFLGVVFGLAGRQIIVAGIQQWFTIIAGCCLLIIVIASILKKNLPGLLISRRGSLFFYKIVSKYIHSPKLSSSFIIGLANGFLPCGMVYLALTGATSTGSIVTGVEFMAAFGLGTIPTMFAFSILNMVANLRIRKIMRLSTPYVMTIMAFILIIRGLSLGIPYLSPNLNLSSSQIIDCH